MIYYHWNQAKADGRIKYAGFFAMNYVFKEIDAYDWDLPNPAELHG